MESAVEVGECKRSLGLSVIIFQPFFIISRNLRILTFWFVFSCDYRMAVIILATISLIIAVINIPFSVASQFDQNSNRVDISSELDLELKSIAEDYNMRFLILAVISIILTIVGLVGAVIFNWILVSPPPPY